MLGFVCCFWVSTNLKCQLELQVSRPFSQDSLAGTNTRHRAVTGLMLGVGVAKEQRQTGGDVSESTSPAQS